MPFRLFFDANANPFLNFISIQVKIISRWSMVSQSGYLSAREIELSTFYWLSVKWLLFWISSSICRASKQDKWGNLLVNGRECGTRNKPVWSLSVLLRFFRLLSLSSLFFVCGKHTSVKYKKLALNPNSSLLRDSIVLSDYKGNAVINWLMQAIWKKINVLDGHQLTSSPTTTYFENDCFASHPLCLCPTGIDGKAPCREASLSSSLPPLLFFLFGFSELWVHCQNLFLTGKESF